MVFFIFNCYFNKQTKSEKDREKTDEEKEKKY